MHTHTCTHTQTLVYHTMHMGTSYTHITLTHSRTHARTHVRTLVHALARVHACTNTFAHTTNEKIQPQMPMLTLAWRFRVALAQDLVFFLIFEVCHSSPTANGRSVTRCHPIPFHIPFLSSGLSNKLHVSPLRINHPSRLPVIFVERS